MVMVGPGRLPWMTVTDVDHGSPMLTSSKGKSIVRIVPHFTNFR